MTPALPDIDAPFRHYTLKHRSVAWVSMNVFGSVTYTVRRGLLRGMKRYGGLAFVPQWIGRLLSLEERFWQAVAIDGRTVYDVGSFEGLLALAFSRRASHVVAYEPMPRNRERLHRNLSLNAIRNVTVRPIGVSDGDGTIRLSALDLMPGGTSGDPEVSAGIRTARSFAETEVPVRTLDADIGAEGVPAPDLLKIDIEGMEAAALRGDAATIRATRPAIHLEWHGDTIRQKPTRTRGPIPLLRETYGYPVVHHLESGRTVVPEAAKELYEGHLFAPSATIASPALPR